MTDHMDRTAEMAGEAGEFDPRSLNEAAQAAGGADRAEESLEGLRVALVQAREEAAANQDRYLRARADMENFRKRLERTSNDRVESVKKGLLGKLLAVKDNLERALQYSDSSGGGEGILEGIRLTQYQLEQMLQSEGVQAMEAEGKAFDPHTEEAVQSVNDPSVPDHTVVQVVRKGYTYGDDVLRPAQVIVSVHGSD